MLNNAFLFISFLFIWGQLFKDKNYILTPTSPLRVRALSGVTSGILGGLLMFFFMGTENFLHGDFRHLAIIISAMNGGFISSVITGLVISYFTVLSEGMGYTSLIVSALMIVISIGCGSISQLNLKKSIKWKYMIGYSIAVHFFTVYISPIPMREKDTMYVVLTVYSILTVIFGFIVYYLWEYIYRSNLLLMKFKEESTTDFLTGLNNVRQFYSLFNDLSKKAIERNESLSLIMVDVDWFKSINDSYGHPSGDAVLIEVSKILKRTCRSIDIISRVGGEEFSVLLENCSYTQAMEIGERIRKEIEKHEFLLPTGKKIGVSVSVGVAAYPNAVYDIEQLIESTDIALYEAKRAGRNRVVLYQ